MNNIVKFSLFAFIAVGIFVALPNNTVLAWDTGGYGGGCCGGGGYDGGYSPSPDPTPVVIPAKCISFTASRTTVPYGGADVTLNWSTQNATSVTLSGYGSVSANGSKTVYVNSNTTLTLTAIGTGGNDSCSVTIKVEAPKPAAKCDFMTANKTSVPAGGGNVTLSWGTTNATSVSINNGVGTVADDGSKTVFVGSNTTFVLTAVGTGGNDSCSVSIKVETTKPVAQCLFLNANKTVVHPDGETITLSWDTKNATSVSINNGVGNVSSTGSKNVFVDSNKTFTLTAIGTGGNDTCNVTITTKPVEYKAPRCDYFNASDSRVEEGDRVTLSWGTTNANRVTISPNVGDVADDGSTTVTVYDDTTYTLRARNLDNGQEVTCTVTVRVDEDEDDTPKKTPRCDLEISKDRVKRGERVTLSWETTNADSVRIRDDNGKTIFDTNDYSKSERKRYFDGSIDVIVNQSTKFTLTAGGVDGGSKTCRVDVDVDDIAIYEKRDQGYVIALTQVPYTGFEAGSFLTFLFYAILTLWALFVAYILVIKKGSILGLSFYGKQAGMSATDIENRKKVEALVAKYAGPNSK